VLLRTGSAPGSRSTHVLDPRSGMERPACRPSVPAPDLSDGPTSALFDARPAIALPVARLYPPYRARSFIMVQMHARANNISTQPVLSRERGWYMVRQ